MSIRAHILTGLHAGAEMELTSGEWNIGTDPLSDILLSDAVIQPTHARLIITAADSVHLEPIGGRCAVNGTAVDTQSADVPLYAHLRLGGDVVLVLGKVGEAWPEGALTDDGNAARTNTGPEDRQPPAAALTMDGDAPREDEVTPSRKTGNGHDEATASEIGRESEDMGKHTTGGTTDAAGNAGAAGTGNATTGKQDTTQGEEPVCPPRTSVQKVKPAGSCPAQDCCHANRLRRVWRRAGAAGTAFGLLLALTLGASFFSSSPEEEKRAAVTSVLRANGQNPAAFIVKESHEGISIKGIVANDVLRDALNGALRGIGKNIHPDVLSLQSLGEDLKARITAEGARVQVTLSGDALRLSGYIYDAQTLGTLLMPLAEQCARVTFQENVTYWRELEPRVADSLRTLHLEDSVKVRAGAYALVLDSAAVPPERRAALRTFERELTDMCGGVPPLTAKAAPALPARPRPPEEAALCRRLSITGEGPSMQVTFDGQPFSRGALLPNGMRVQEIRPDYVTLERGNNLHYCPMR